MSNTYKNTGTLLTTISSTVIYTCPTSSTALIKAVYLANLSVTNSTFGTVQWYDDSQSKTFTIITSALIPIQSSLQPIDEPIVLEENDILYVTGATNLYVASSVDVTLSILEIT